MKKIAIEMVFLVAFVLLPKISLASSVSVLSPNGGEVWNIGENRTISWLGNPSFVSYGLELWEGSVVFDGKNLSGGNVWRIVGNTKGTSYFWKVGDVDCGGECTVPSKGNYKIVVRGKKINGSSDAFDYSDTNFSLSGGKGFVKGNNIVAQGQNLKAIELAKETKNNAQEVVQAEQGVVDTQLMGVDPISQMANTLAVAKQVLVQMLAYLNSLIGK